MGRYCRREFGGNRGGGGGQLRGLGGEVGLVGVEVDGDRLLA